jgi:hypothetical protein
MKPTLSRSLGLGLFALVVFAATYELGPLMARLIMEAFT